MCFYHFHIALLLFSSSFRLMFFTLLRCLNNTFREGGCGRSERFRNIHLMRMMMLMIRFSLYLWFRFILAAMVFCFRGWNVHGICVIEIFLRFSWSFESQISFSFNSVQEHSNFEALSNFCLNFTSGNSRLKASAAPSESDRTCMITLCLTLPHVLSY